MCVMFDDQEIEQLPFSALRLELLRLRSVPSYAVSRAYVDRVLCRAVDAAGDAVELDGLVRQVRGWLNSAVQTSTVDRFWAGVADRGFTAVR